MIKFSCKNCAQQINVPEVHAGKRGKCPKCGEIILVPDKSTFFTFRCGNCGQKINFSKMYAGKKGRCPRCNNIFVIPKGKTSFAAAIQAGPDSEKIAPKAFSPDPRLFDMPKEMSAAGQPSGQQLVSDSVLDDEQRLRQVMMVGRIEHEPPPERKKPWFFDIFLYPTNKSGLTMIGIIIGIPILFGLVFAFMYFLAFIFPPMLILMPVIHMIGVILGFIIFVIFGMYYYWYLCECVRDSAEGGIRAPETIGHTPGLGELFSESWKTCVCLMFFALPMFLYFLYTGKIDWIFWTLLGFGVFLFPMGLLAVIMFDTLSALNPAIIIGSIFSAFFPYLGLILMLGVVIVSVRYLMPLYNLITSGGSSLLAIGTILVYSSGIADFYMFMVMAHLLGRFFYKYQERLNWEV
jgi:DNA-directed RNA polymerase subunit RPC12/RpoP